MEADRRIVLPSEQSIALAAELLAQGHLVGVPTETVYGLAADATNPEAVAKIYQAKGRPPNNPLIMHCETEADARSWVHIDDSPELRSQWAIAATFWPGPLTVVAPHDGRVPGIVTAGSPSVAVRVPSHPVIQWLLSVCDFPIAAPSANLSNYVSPTTAEHVASAFGDQVRMILDGGACPCGLESTIVRLDAAGVQLLRPGAISAEQLQEAFGRIHVRQTENRSTSDGEAAGPMDSPGLMAKHYSPATPLMIAGQVDPGVDPASIARIAFFPIPKDQADRFGWYRCLSETGDLVEVARHLYTAIREADASGSALISIDRCERSGIGRAIMDRIDRAVH